MPTQLVRFALEHPYWACFSRAVLTAIFQSVAILVLVHRAIVAIFIIEWVSGWRHSRNTQMRLESDLRYFNVVWGLGKALGALIGVFITNIWLHPHDTGWLHPSRWPSLLWLDKLL